MIPIYLKSNNIPILDRNVINKNISNISDELTTLSTTKVPYTGATGTVNLGSQKLITEEVESVGDLTIDCGTEKTLVLQEPVWEDLRFPAQAINPVGLTGPAGVDATEPYLGTLLFDAGSTEICCGQAQFPHARKLSSPIVCHIHWCPTSTDTGNVLWRLSYMVAEIGGTFSGSYIDIDILTASSGVVGRHQKSKFTTISNIGTDTSTMMLWKISRIGGDGTDTYTGDARLLEFDIHYQIDTIGSRTELSK